MKDHKDEVIAYFEEAAKSRAGVYDGEDTVAYRVQQWLKEAAIKLCSGSGSVLDAGCGNGDFLEMCAARYPHCRLVGVDISSAMLDVSRLRSQGKGLDIDFRLGSLASIPAKDGEVETVVSIGVFHHLLPEEQKTAYAEVCRVASKNIVLEIKNTFSPYHMVKKLRSRYGRMGMRISGTNPISLSASLKRHGFRLAGTIGFLPGFLGLLLSPVLLFKFEKAEK